jgi:hypothetical protein
MRPAHLCFTAAIAVSFVAAGPALADRGGAAKVRPGAVKRAWNKHQVSRALQKGKLDRGGTRGFTGEKVRHLGYPVPGTRGMATEVRKEALNLASRAHRSERGTDGTVRLFDSAGATIGSVRGSSRREGSVRHSEVTVKSGARTFEFARTQLAPPRGDRKDGAARRTVTTTRAAIPGLWRAERISTRGAITERKGTAGLVRQDVEHRVNYRMDRSGDPSYESSERRPAPRSSERRPAPR